MERTNIGMRSAALALGVTYECCVEGYGVPGECRYPAKKRCAETMNRQSGLPAYSGGIQGHNSTPLSPAPLIALTTSALTITAFVAWRCTPNRCTLRKTGASGGLTGAGK